MKHERQRIGLILAMVLVFSSLYTPALVLGGTPDVVVTPVQFFLFVHGKSVSLSVY